MNEVKKITSSDIISVSLPLLDYVDDMYKLERDLPFLGYKILAVQHLLGASIPLFGKFEKGGIKPSDIHIVGKAYSSHPEVVKYLQGKGYDLSFESVFDFAKDQPYDDILEKNIINMASILLGKFCNNQKCLIIDDGAKAIRLLHEKYPSLAKQFACVEQTSRGTRLVKTLDLLCPVVDVARSNAKTMYEAPMIADAMVKEFMVSVKQWQEARVYGSTKNHLLILGYGFIGENVAKKISKYGFNIRIYDSDLNQLKKAQRDGFIIVENLDKAYDDVDVLLGCSGVRVISEDDLQKLKSGTLLVNMASTDTEFSAWLLRPYGEIVHQNILSIDLEYLSEVMPLSWRSLYKVQLAEEKYLYLANGGFPVDFSGKVNPIPAEDIQLTSSLLLGGAIQAVCENESGLIKLDTVLQDRIIAEYLCLKEGGDRYPLN